MSVSRIRYLDGLRGILALVVFLHHFLYAFYPEVIFGGNSSYFISHGWSAPLKLLALTPFNLLFNPGFAIHFFFLLSGYVQSYHFFVRKDTLPVQRSFIKRYFRLALPTTVVLLAVWMCHMISIVHNDLIPDNRLNASWVQNVVNTRFSLPDVLYHGLIGCFQGNSPYYQVLWTMPTELMNSWLILILLFVTNRMKRPALWFLVWLLVQVFVLNAYYGAAFTIGMLVAHLQNEERPGFLFRLRLLKWPVLLIGIYFGSYPYTGYQGAMTGTVYSPISFFDTYPHIISYLIGVVFIFVFLVNSLLAQRMLEWRPLLFIGDISFMLYLLHFIVIFTLSPLLWSYFSGMGVILQVSLSLLLTTIAVVLLSYAFTKWVDEPILKMINRLVAKLWSPENQR